jgi:UDP-N-acetylmuramate--alanine ligase
VLALFQPHLYSRTLHLAGELAEALTRADIACVTDIYPAREDPIPGVSGKLVVDRVAELRPGMRIGWAPGLVDAAALVAKQARPGDIVLTIGAGDVDSALELLAERIGR